MTNEEAGDHVFAVNGLTAEEMRLHAAIEAAGGPEVFIAALRDMVTAASTFPHSHPAGLSCGLCTVAADARALLAKLPK